MAPSPEASYSPIKASVTTSLPPMTRFNSATSTKPAESAFRAAALCFYHPLGLGLLQDVARLCGICIVAVAIGAHVKATVPKQRPPTITLPFFSTSKRAKSCIILSCKARSCEVPKTCLPWRRAFYLKSDAIRQFCT